jgi:hypothetical protein
VQVAFVQGADAARVEPIEAPDRGDQIGRWCFCQQAGFDSGSHVASIDQMVAFGKYLTSSQGGAARPGLPK